MQHDLVVEGKLVLPGSLEQGQVGVSGGMVREVKKQGLSGERVVRAGECLVFPGFIDCHVHLREPGWERKEDFRTGTIAAVHGGVTTAFDMPNNPVPTTTVSAIEQKMKLAKGKAVVDVRFYAGVSGGRLGEIAGLRDRAIGYKLYLSKTTGEEPFPEEELGQALSAISSTGKPVSFHCEDQSIIDESSGRLSDGGRPDAYADMRPPESEVESVRKAADAVRRSNGAKGNLCHLSTGDSIRVVREAREGGLALRCEAALHHLYFDRRDLAKNPLLRTNPPLRSPDDRRSLIEGLRDGSVSFLVTDHAPHTLDEKRDEQLAGVPGLDDYGHVVSWLITKEGIDPGTVARAGAASPAQFFGLSDRGEISPGKRGDLTVVDLRSPEKVRSESILSKCGWSPYEGVEFPGRVRWVFSLGKPLMDDSQQFTG
ncbi:MAG: dihydroorotase family protein [Thaumarchaeota archaeon]|nr:dihydroorotase family protein [Nitrososphaerota archaeon]